MKPSSPRPRTQSVAKRVKAKFKIIPELRAAVDILKSRLNDSSEEKSISRPSTRLKVDRLDSVSPGFYHRPSHSTGGWEFSKVARLEDSITHQISGIYYLALKTHKKFENPKNFEKANKKVAKNISEFRLTLQEKAKKHNEKVKINLKKFKVRKFEEINYKKQEFLIKTENLKWRENCWLEIGKGQEGWSTVIAVVGVAWAFRVNLLLKKQMRVRVYKFLKFLKKMSKFLGIFMVMLRKKRKFLEFKNVRALAPPTIFYINHEIKVFEKSISKYMYKLVNDHQLMLLISFWKRSIIKVQRAYRKFCKVKEARLIAISKVYTKFVPNSKKENRRVSLVPVANFLSINHFTARQKRTLFMNYLLEFLYKHIKERYGMVVKLFTEKTAMVSYLLIHTNGFGKQATSRKRNTDVYVH